MFQMFFWFSVKHSSRLKRDESMLDIDSDNVRYLTANMLRIVSPQYIQDTCIYLDIVMYNERSFNVGIYFFNSICI